MSIQIILGDDRTIGLLEQLVKQGAEFRLTLNSLKELIMKSETEVSQAIQSAVSKVVGDIAAAITKEKQELIDVIKAIPPGGISDSALASLLDNVAGIGTSSVAGIDKLSVDVAPSQPPVTP